MKLTLTILLFASFTAFPFDINAQIRTSTIRVRVNTEKNVPRAGFRVRLLQVVDDSRCPEDTNCVWAGNAKVKIQVRGGRGGRRTFELNSTTQPQVATYAGYEIRLTDLTPRPRSNIRINPNGYVATIEIKRAGR
jgi:hypothetical protein